MLTSTVVGMGMQPNGVRLLLASTESRTTNIKALEYRLLKLYVHFILPPFI